MFAIDPSYDKLYPLAIKPITRHLSDIKSVTRGLYIKRVNLDPYVNLMIEPIFKVELMNRRKSMFGKGYA